MQGFELKLEHVTIKGAIYIKSLTNVLGLGRVRAVRSSHMYCYLREVWRSG